MDFGRRMLWQRHLNGQGHLRPQPVIAAGVGALAAARFWSHLQDFVAAHPLGLSAPWMQQLGPHHPFLAFSNGLQVQWPPGRQPHLPAQP